MLLLYFIMDIQKVLNWLDEADINENNFSQQENIIYSPLTSNNISDEPIYHNL